MSFISHDLSARSIFLLSCLVALPLIREDEHAGAAPSRLLRRIREGGKWWLLVVYEDEYETRGWKGFPDETSVEAFAASANAGEPLKIPPVSLSPEESATVVSKHRQDQPMLDTECRCSLEREVHQGTWRGRGCLLPVENLAIVELVHYNSLHATNSSQQRPCKIRILEYATITQKSFSKIMKP